MIRRIMSALALFGLLIPAVARAETVDFSYSFSISPTQTFASGTGSVTFSLFGGGAITANVGDTTALQAASIFTTSSATDTPDVFSSPYVITMSIKDNTSGQSRDFSFDGMLDGSLTATGSKVSAIFTGPLTVTQTLGSYLYSVSVEPETANLPMPGSLADALLNANVKIMGIPVVVVDPPGPGTTVSETPEPTGLVLGLLGGPILYLARRRYRSGK